MKKGEAGGARRVEAQGAAAEEDRLCVDAQGVLFRRYSHLTRSHLGRGGAEPDQLGSDPPLTDHFSKISFFSSGSK